MTEFEHGGAQLGRIHRRNNDKKFFCHFTGFLEGVAASGFLESGEVEPLIVECIEFVRRGSDGDASDIIEDFSSDLLEFDTIASAAEIRLSEIDGDCEKSSLNRFLGYCRGIACDGVITSDEAAGIVLYLDQNPSLLAIVGARQILVACVDALEDQILSPEESQEICDAIGHVVGDCYADTGLSQTSGVANFKEARLGDLDELADGAVLVLTGTFQTRPRKLLEEQLVALGAVISRSVTSKTDFLLIGGEASRDWIELNRGTKLRKAQALRLSGPKPEFLSESQIMRHLSC